MLFLSVNLFGMLKGLKLWRLCLVGKRFGVCRRFLDGVGGIKCVFSVCIKLWSFWLVLRLLLMVFR